MTQPQHQVHWPEPDDDDDRDTPDPDPWWNRPASWRLGVFIAAVVVFETITWGLFLIWLFGR